MSPRQMVNAERTVLVTVWEDGTAEVAFRDEPGATWGPPIPVEPEFKEDRVA